MCGNFSEQAQQKKSIDSKLNARNVWMLHIHFQLSFRPACQTRAKSGTCLSSFRSEKNANQHLYKSVTYWKCDKIQSCWDWIECEMSVKRKFSLLWKSSIISFFSYFRPEPKLCVSCLWLVNAKNTHRFTFSKYLIVKLQERISVSYQSAGISNWLTVWIASQLRLNGCDCQSISGKFSLVS